MNQKFIVWFTQLESRERRVLISGAIALVIIAGYSIVYEPFVKARAQLENIVTAQQVTLQWMQNASAEIQQLRAESSSLPQINTQISLLSLIDQNLRQSPLNKIDKRIDPKGENSVDIYFEHVNFTELMRWLGQLHNQHHIKVNMISIEKLASPDTVKIRMTLNINYEFQITNYE